MIKKLSVLFLTLILVLSSVSMAFGCGTTDTSYIPKEKYKPQQQVEEDDEIEYYYENINRETLEGFTLNQIKSFHTELQSDFINGNLQIPDNTVNGKTELSRPAPVTITWPAIKDALKYKVLISENADMTGAMLYWTNADGSDISTNSLTFDNNLKSKTVYWYQAVARNNGAKSKIMCFMTDDVLPRNIYVDGITNMRDLGGYIVEGNTVKQGMIYRSGRLNKSKATTLTVEITEAGKKTMLETLGIKTEIDLRRDAEEIGGLNGVSVLGSGVKYFNCAMQWNGGANTTRPYLEQNFPSICKVFEILADKDNYPVFFHCDIGTDRTGMMAYFIGAVLGEDKETLKKDYLFSNFGNINGSRDTNETHGFTFYEQAIDDAEGETLAEKAEYLLINTVGVQKADIDALKEIMLEDCVYEQGVVVSEPTATANGLTYYKCTNNPAKSYYKVTTYVQQEGGAASLQVALPTKTGMSSSDEEAIAA